MRKFTLEINCDNAAFGDDPVPELKRLLKMVRWSAGQVLYAGMPSIVDHTILDENGNTVGYWSFATDRPSAEVTSKVAKPPPRSNEAKTATHGLTYGNPSLDDTYLKASIVKDGFTPPTSADGRIRGTMSTAGSNPLPAAGGRDYPAKKRKKKPIRILPDSRGVDYFSQETPPDTPSLDTSFHDHEMDVD